MNDTKEIDNNMNNNVIYKIYCKDENIKDFYIGSSTNLYVRINVHKCRCNNKDTDGYYLKLYEFIRENGGWENFNIEVIEYFNCNSKKELIQKEQEYINKLKPSLNYLNAYVTDEIKKERKKIADKKMRESQKRKDWFKQKKYCKYCNSFTTNGGWSKHTRTKIHLENIEKKSSLTDKQLNELNEKNKIEDKKEKFINCKKYCEICDTTVKLKNWSIHKKSKTHMNNMIEKTDFSEEHIKELNEKYNIKTEDIEETQKNLLQKKSEKIKCEFCNIFLTKNCISRHKKSKIHLENIEKKKNGSAEN
tara:strand:- start:419 stop:1333 length:915 start_codon:yes stop_codon:yes gene_type:complete